MPFWQKVQRCENCAYWQRQDPSLPGGVCTAEHALPRRPFWAEPRQFTTQWDDGMACSAYRHDAHKPHVLDDARAFIALAEVGDLLPMRTYRIGAVDHTLAEVVHRNNTYFTVRMLNGTYRIRLDGTTTERSGTVMGMEEWGVDLEGEIVRTHVDRQHPEQAIQIIKSVEVGDTLTLVGYPPFHRMRKTAKVLGVSDKYLTIRIDRHRRKSKMHAAGPLAGIIEGEVWSLDTSGETHHDTKTYLHAGTGDCT